MINFGKGTPIEEGESRKRNREVDYLAPETLKGDKESIVSNIYSFDKLVKLFVKKRIFTLPFEALAAYMTTGLPEDRISIALYLKS